MLLAPQQMVGGLLNRMTEDEGEYRPIDGPEIGSLILIDRGEQM